MYEDDRIRAKQLKYERQQAEDLICSLQQKAFAGDCLLREIKERHANISAMNGTETQIAIFALAIKILEV